ncbi:hypothetical protein BASA81_013528 [Batrachochytrium salamandrivorans]|nr:hypothetical protein BASA81_013528 [Batrachochytrium salamandrivorans]
MDLPFSLRELDHALGSMHPRKAPGDDGITTALMQAIAHDPKDHGTGDVNLDRPGALALLRVANTIFLSGVIPKVWRRQLHSRSSTSSACQYRHSHDSQGPFIHPITPMLTDCGIISLDAHAILARLKHQPIHPKHPILTHQNHYYIHYYPLTPTIAEIRHQRSKYALERTFQVWGKSKLACSYVQANHASSAKFLRSPALSTGQAIGASLLSLARCGGLWDYPRALKAGLYTPQQQTPTSWAVPACVYSVMLTWTASPWPTWW